MNNIYLIGNICIYTRNKLNMHKNKILDKLYIPNI